MHHPTDRIIHTMDNTYHIPALAGTRNSSVGPPHEGSIWRPIAPWVNTLTTELHLAPVCPSVLVCNLSRRETLLHGRASAHGAIGQRINPLLVSLQPVFHDLCNKGYGMCYPVCGMVHIKEPLLLTGKNIPCGSRFPLSLIGPLFLTPYNHK